MEFAFKPAACWSAPSTWFAAAPSRRASPRRPGADVTMAVDALQTLARGAAAQTPAAARASRSAFNAGSSFRWRASSSR
jgi:hypothetical protein